jgi:hypothetical protein
MGYIPALWTVLKQSFVKKKASQPANNGRRVVFENSGPSGYAIYYDGVKAIKFYTEVGGGNCIFYISIPSAQTWEKETTYPVEKRNDILAFIAEESLKKQARIPGAYFKMNETSIVFYAP